MTCGKKDEEDIISFELFARSVALMLEENTDKVSTSSQQEQREMQQYMEEEISEGQLAESQDPYGQEQQDGEQVMDDPYYDEYDVD